MLGRICNLLGRICNPALKLPKKLLRITNLKQLGSEAAGH